MRHALWILVLVAACGRDGTSSETPESAPANVVAKPSLLSLSRDTQGLQVTTGPKGKQVRLDGTFQSAVIARRAADGALETNCFDEATTAETYMQVTPPTAARKVEVQ